MLFINLTSDSGSLNRVFSGSRCNKAWYFHNVMPEALETLFLQRFIGEVSYIRFSSTRPCLIIGGTSICTF